jgi:ankyrin repeat domain-containing protein 50
MSGHDTPVSGLSRKDYTVGWLTALPVELAAAKALLDTRHPDLNRRLHDSNCYVLGRIGKHNVVITSLPSGDTGTNSAAFVAAQMMSSFPSIGIRLMVGIGGGVPFPNDVRLGDVVISRPRKTNRGVVQHDFGILEADGIRHTRVLNGPPDLLLSAITILRASKSLDSQIRTYLSKMTELDPRFSHPGERYDLLFNASYEHAIPKSCEKCDPHQLIIDRPARRTLSPVIHYGGIASGNQVIMHAGTRDRLSKEHNVLCFEMEAAGLMNHFPCLVIRGISDYADSHKTGKWQYYAAATAAAYAKALLESIPLEEVMPATDNRISRIAQT